MNGIPEAPMCEDAQNANPITSTEKRCIKCGTTLNDLNWNRTKKLKHHYICLKCDNKYKKEWAHKDEEKTRIGSRKRMRKWREKNPEKAKTASLFQSHKRREKQNKYSRNYSKANRIIKNAHLKAYYAVKSGLLIQQPCAICGKTDTVKHHNDYLKPLDVIWLCTIHHARLHRWKD